jgi:hypothetical protein
MESSLYGARTIPIFMTMTAAPQYRARRATVEDLPQLISLWQLEQLPAASLEKRFKEFQVVSDAAGQVVGTIGLQVNGGQGVLHGESVANGNHWQVLTLRTPDANAAIEREFARMQALQQEEKAKMQATVAWMKRAAFVALFLLMLIAAGAIFVVRYAPQLFRK